jgi:membrane protease YdiL (CAAX protease family)
MKLAPIFKAKDGRIRLFWRLISYTVLFLVIGLAANQVHRFLKCPDSPSCLAEIVFAAIFILGVLGLTGFYRLFVDKRPWSGMAIPSLWRHWPKLVTGSMWLLLLMPTPLVILAFAVGQLRVAGSEIADSGWFLSLQFVLAGLSNSFVIGFCEELAMRGYVFQNLGERYALWLATLFNGLLFGLLHFWGGLDVAEILTMVLLSAVFITLRLCTRSIWAAIGLHTAFNWVYTSLLGFSSSAGAGYGHALLHIDAPGSTETSPAYALLGDIDSLPAKAIFCGLIILMLLGWNRLKGRQIDWGARLESDGSIAHSTTSEGP